MEEDSKASPWSIKNMLSLNKDHSNLPTSTDRTGGEVLFQINRYKHDMKVAKAMRLGMEKHKRKKRNYGSQYSFRAE
jgi:hypothetical protein